MTKAGGSARPGKGVAQIVAALEEDIALGLLAPRERLVEEDLAARFVVNRHVIRQVLVELDSMGIVVRQPNRGAAVRDYSTKEVEQLWLVRTLVETCAAKLLPLPAPKSLIQDLRAIHERHCTAVDSGDLPRVFRENIEFHRVFFAACGNAPLTELIEQLQLKTHAIRSYSIANPKVLAAVRAEHAQLILLLQKGDRRHLVKLVGSHIQHSKDAYLELSRHRTGTPRRAAHMHAS